MTPVGSALVIGGTGFIGSALLRRLVREGVDTRSLVFKDRPRRPPLVSPAIEAASSGIADLTDALKGREFDVVFHLAAAGVSPDERQADILLDGNLGLLTRVLQSLSTAPPGRFIYAGSCAEYSPAIHGQLIDEEWLARPSNIYGAAKAASTIFGAALARQLNIPFVTLRPFHVFGGGEAASRLIPYLIVTLHREETVNLTVGSQTRDLLHVDDVVEAFLAAAHSPLAPFDVFNVCSGQPVAVRDIALEVARILGRPVRLLNFNALPYRPDEDMWLVGDNRRFTQATGWAPKLTLEAGLKQTILSLLGSIG